VIEIPTVDISPIRLGDAQARRRASEQAADAARTLGMFFVTGHAIPEHELAALSGRWRALFDQPAAEKAQIAWVDGRGYLAPPALDDPSREYKESFTLMHPQPEAAWPSQGDLRAQLELAFARFEALSVELLRLLGLGLGGTEALFLDRIGASACVLRIVHYLAPDTHGAAPGRCEAHTDYGTISILLIDDAPGGLELLTGPDTWEPVPVARGRLLVNLGDTLQTWTDGRWPAPVHRVVNPPANERARSRRQSIVFFHNPESILAKVIDYLRT
jgi:isopenicillin N synthase-like dioxygenase